MSLAVPRLAIIFCLLTAKLVVAEIIPTDFEKFNNSAQLEILKIAIEEKDKVKIKEIIKRVPQVLGDTNNTKQDAVARLFDAAEKINEMPEEFYLLAQTAPHLLGEIEECGDSDNLGDTTPLMRAISLSNDENLLGSLIQLNPKSIRTQTSSDKIALFTAIESNKSLDFIKQLIDLWPESIKLQDTEGLNILDYAASGRNLEALRYFFQIKDLDFNKMGNQILMSALDISYANKELFEIVSLILEKFPKSIYQRNYIKKLPLHIIASRHFPESTKILDLIYQKNPRAIYNNESGDYPLHEAVLGNPENFEYLFKKDPTLLAKRNRLMLTPIEYALGLGHYALALQYITDHIALNIPLGPEGFTLGHCLAKGLSKRHYYIQNEKIEDLRALEKILNLPHIKKDLVTPNIKNHLPIEETYAASMIFQKTLEAVQESKSLVFESITIKRLLSLLDALSIQETKTLFQQFPTLKDLVSKNIDEIMKSDSVFFITLNNNNKSRELFEFFVSFDIRFLEKLEFAEMNLINDFSAIKTEERREFFMKLPPEKQDLLIKLYRIPQVWKLLSSIPDLLHYRYQRTIYPYIFAYHPTPIRNLEMNKQIGLFLSLNLFHDKFIYELKKEKDFRLKNESENWSEFFEILAANKVENLSQAKDALLNESAWSLDEYLIVLENYLITLGEISSYSEAKINQYNLQSTFHNYSRFIINLTHAMESEYQRAIDEQSEIDGDFRKSSLRDVFESSILNAHGLKREQLIRVLEELIKLGHFSAYERGSDEEVKQKAVQYLQKNKDLLLKKLQRRRDKSTHFQKS